MKRHYLHLVMSLLAGACLAAASCSDSDKDIKAPSPNFPEAVSPTIGAGETYTIEIDPNQDWEVSIPTATAAWFWIEDETQKVWTLRGGAGPARIVIAAAELEEFDDDRVCEVTMTMGGQSKVIATITRGTLDRGFTLRTCQLDEYGDFIYNSDGTESGLAYLYNTDPAESVTLTWPEGYSAFSMPILVEANFEWVLSKLPEWLEVPSKTIGEPGAKIELRLQGDASRYPLDGADETLVFTDKNNAEVSYGIPISIPACRDIFSVSGMSAETKFNAKAEYFNSMNGDWVSGSAMGRVQSIDGAKFSHFEEVKHQWGDPYLSADAEDLAWLLLTEEPWDSTPGSDVVQSRQFTVGVTENGGEARKAYLLALPAAVAETISNPYQLIDAEIRDEYKQYLVTTINQEANPGSISANNPAGMTEIGAAFEKLPANDWYIGEFGVRDGYKLIYTKEWSNDPKSTLTVDREYTGVAFFDYDLQLMSGGESWLSVRETAEGIIVDMDPAKDKCGDSSMSNEGIAHIGFAVFTDADGRFALIQCIYDENYPIGGDGDDFEVKFAMPDLVNGATLVQITRENYQEIAGGNSNLLSSFTENLAMGVQLYMLTYTSAAPSNAVLEVSPYQLIMIMPMGVEWLDYEPMSDTQILISMAKPEAEQASYGMVQFFDSSWNMKCIVYCMPAF
ncbi:MAG: hypothetical protein LUC96_11985 [Alistipes sp.]|uniref:hypothetical protein n=1 Tax=Alistipes sp. TaxID=1872444 RepID=UPI0025B8A957|nr:hypothetical protein [Alistipes sp.]MCD8275676.1 hypothetical protein [Alistipes sp.]